MSMFIRYILLLISVVIFNNCTTTQLVQQWKNPEIDTLTISKVLIIGMTPNIEVRDQFEKLLKKEFELRGVDAVVSLDIFEPDFTTEKKTKKELKVIENILTANFFDAVLFTKVVGIEDKEVFLEEYKEKKYLDVKFKEDYYNHQDILEDSRYYKKYKIYNAESSLYCICPTKDRELIWKGYIDVVNPTSLKETVNDYVNLLILVLEKQNLLKKQ
ncbi:hypothetical protein PG911_01965 [Tenacibaculum ovolyticum]|uniref:hypothetical protein n=1 Tax=Tenacibaculum ovolyticum TaxID=104270 RepID=UPI000AD1EA47|nr:hypothetical protein [Tenacibaculum ovolyticum]WBX77049.1 hypothetical protein PG911_01965 [Tenacibaculum ovolyticum]